MQASDMSMRCLRTLVALFLALEGQPWGGMKGAETLVGAMKPQEATLRDGGESISSGDGSSVVLASEEGQVWLCREQWFCRDQGCSQKQCSCE